MKKNSKFFVTLGAVTFLACPVIAQSQTGNEAVHLNADTLSQATNSIQNIRSLQTDIVTPNSEVLQTDLGVSQDSAVLSQEPAIANKENNSEAVNSIGEFDADGRAYSKVGIARNLPLYDTDKSDTCVAGALQIRAKVNNVSEEGILKLELFGERNFMKAKGKLRRIRVPAEQDSQIVCINLPATGDYAVVGYHDVNGDRKLKKAWNFRPLEPYGLSNNPVIKSLRLPRFSETRFEVPISGVDIEINLVGPDN